MLKSKLVKPIFLPHYGQLIGNQRISSTDTIKIENPVDGSILCTVSNGQKEHVDLAIQTAKSTFDSGIWSRSDSSHRFKVLNRIARELESQIESFALKESLQTGRCIREMRIQLSRLPEWIEYFASVARTDQGYIPPFKGDMVNLVTRVPLGVCGQITPWNHPLLIAIKKIAPAIAAGNSVVLKPSELAPISVLDFGQMCLDCGLPPGVLNVITGYGNTAGKALCENKSIAKLDITGGTETGRLIASKAGENLITCTAELGGKTPLIVFEDANLQDAVNGAAFAAFIASGQTCVMGSRILIQSSIYESFVSRFISKVHGIQVGDPLENTTDMGPVICESQLIKIQEFVRKAQQQGAKILTGGERIPGKGYFYPPTVIGNCTRDMSITREEVFGPVVVLLPFENEQEAIELANDSPFGLAAGVWTMNIKRGHAVSQELDVGITWVNGHHHNDPSSPWGGFKESGMGKENGMEAYHSYTKSKSLILNYGNSSDWFGQRDARYG